MISKITAVILAAGRSTRMGAANKLLEMYNGKTLVRHVADAAVASTASDVVVVTGHEEMRVHDALADLPLRFVSNPAFTLGLAASLSVGLTAVEESSKCADGALVLLGDMPLVTPTLIDRIISAFKTGYDRNVCVPYRQERRGNPVLWPRAFFPELKALSGDTGARELLTAYADVITRVEVETNAIFTDVDTPIALAALRGARK